MSQSILGKSTLQTEKEKIYKTIKLHFDTNQQRLRRAGIENSEGPDQQRFYKTFM